MTQPDLLAAVTPVVNALERLGVGYSIVGSIASSVHGVARASIDADVVGIITVQGDQLDLDSMQAEAATLGLEDLLAAALDAARR